MKKLLPIILIFVLPLLLVSCKSEQNLPVVNTMEDAVAGRVEEAISTNDLSDETIKALSVIIRTNETLFPSDSKNISSNERIKNLCTSTKDLVLEPETSEPSENNDLKTKISYYYGSSNDAWQREISKSEILKFLKENNISLSSISNIEVEKTDDGEVEFIIIGGKSFNFGKIASRFDLPSNKITKIFTSLSSVTISGEGTGHTNSFSISKAEQLSKEGKNYKEILSELLKDTQISSNVKNY